MSNREPNRAIVSNREPNRAIVSNREPNRAIVSNNEPNRVSNRVEEPNRASQRNGANGNDGASYPMQANQPARATGANVDLKSQQKRDYTIGASRPQAVAISRIIIMITEHLLISYSLNTITMHILNRL